jgi:aspartyl-tRNA(Asn)/glutamyl-tRNA(Gln) amidotransferase subunit A
MKSKDELCKLTIVEAINALKAKSFSAVELITAHLEKAKASKLNAFTEITEEIALTAAAQADKKLANGTAGLIEGIPIGVKDLFCTKGVKTTACSKILSNFVPRYESTVTQNLFNNGGIMLGKTNMDEFAMGSSNTTSAAGNVINPWRRHNDKADLVPGGSSGGSSAAVAAGLCMGALGSDTGGSIRQPASYTGIVGVKPTYGRCSRWGMIAFASSLDQAGVFTRTVADSALLLQAICGYDVKDSTSMNIPVPEFSKQIGQSIAGMRIGIPTEYYMEGMNAEVAKLWDEGKKWLQAAGANIVDISLPHTKYALATYYIIAPAEASSNLARYDGVRYGKRADLPAGASLDDLYELTRANGFGAEVRRRIMIGTYVLSAGYYDAYYVHAQKVRRLIQNDFLNAFAKCDAILTPATPTAAFAIGENLDPLAMYLNDVFTVPASLAGLPGMAIPAGLNSQGLPLGLQLIGKAYDEETLFRLSAALEKEAGFNLLTN